MENSKLIEILRIGVETWNKWREEHFEIIPNFSGEDLSFAELNRVNLKGAILVATVLDHAELDEAQLVEADLRGAILEKSILRGADLKEAKISRANLKETDLSGANLEKAKLIKANLRFANLKYTNLKNASLRWSDLSYADLSYSDISGADITGANSYRWKIDGIKCSKIIWDNKKINYANTNDFEKAFTQIRSVVEIILNLPFSEFSHLTGRAIENVINKKYGEGSIFFKGQTAISDDQTKFQFFSLLTSDRLHEINERIAGLEEKLNPIIEEAKSKNQPQDAIAFKSEIEIPFFNFLVLRPKEIEKALVNRYYRISPILQDIIYAIQLHFQ